MSRIYSAIVLATIMLLSGCSINNPSNGSKIGQFVKVSSEGILCKTTEAELVRGGFQGGSGTTGTSFHVTIENDSMAALAERLMNEQKEIKLKYRTEGIAYMCRSESSNNFVVAIDTVVGK
jgi:hypothetical protein